MPADERRETDQSSDGPFDACAHCGARLRPDVWYPATSVRDEDGTPRLYSFCDEACEAAWEESETPPQR